MGASKSTKAPASSPPSPSSAPSKDAELVNQIAALIVPGVTSSAEVRIRKDAQREFWTEMRERLSVNQSSSGLFVLDQLAEALLDDASTEDKEMAFTDPVMLLPKPSRQREAPNAYVHNRFSNTQNLPDVNVNSAPVIFGKGTPSAKIPSPTKPSKSKKKKSPMKEAATEALLALGKGKPSPKEAKAASSSSALGKRKKTGKSDDEQKIKFPKPTPTPTPETDYCPFVMSDNTPPSILQDVEAIYRRAANMGKTCQELAYPWEGSTVWIPPLRINEEDRPGYSPIKRRDGTFTALQAAPLQKPINERDSDSFEPDSSDEDSEVEVLESKAPAPKFASSGHK
eukprot:jgi/Phyca11/19605/fgenesh1_pg.PHYCAscaffold_50_\